MPVEASNSAVPLSDRKSEIPSRSLQEFFSSVQKILQPWTSGMPCQATEDLECTER